MGKKQPARPKQLGRLLPNADNDETDASNVSDIGHVNQVFVYDLCGCSFQILLDTLHSNKRPVLVTNYSSRITAWTDVFDVTASVDLSWWPLAELPGGGADLLSPGKLRTMQNRLWAAKQLFLLKDKNAAYTAVKGVLLTLDVQPKGPEEHLQQLLALEACSRVLVRGARPVTGPGRAFEGTVPPEWSLWMQLQQARAKLMVKRPYNVRGEDTVCLFSVGSQAAETVLVVAHFMDDWA
jgi:hypothetical protein